MRLKTTLLIAIFSFAVTVANAGTLQFSQVLIVDNNLQTVPSGKVWKVTSIYGAVYNTYCIGRPDLMPSPSQWVKAAIASGFIVNSKPVFSIFKYSNSTERWGTSSCTSSVGCCSDYTAYSQATDPLILPMWLPAGTTLQSLSSDVRLSVLEFDVIP